MAHILTHVVPKSIKKTFVIQEIITKVKTIVIVVKRNVVLLDELIRLQKRDEKSDGSILKFKQDVVTVRLLARMRKVRADLSFARMRKRMRFLSFSLGYESRSRSSSSDSQVSRVE